jgi:hypothetical protein
MKDQNPPLPHGAPAIAPRISSTGRQIEFLKDGSGISPDGTAFTWKVESGRIYLNFGTKALSANYTVSGKTLTLADDDGKTLSEFNKHGQ